MTELFPEPIRRLPEADIPLAGVTAHLSQSASHQIIPGFLRFADAVLYYHRLFARV